MIDAIRPRESPRIIPADRDSSLSPAECIIPLDRGIIYRLYNTPCSRIKNKTKKNQEKGEHTPEREKSRLEKRIEKV
jgi:hypothetical protein